MSVKHRPERSGEGLYDIADDYQEKFEQGMERGLEQGMERGKMETARRMLESGRFSTEEIAAYSGLAVKQVHELKKEM